MCIKESFDSTSVETEVDVSCFKNYVMYRTGRRSRSKGGLYIYSGNELDIPLRECYVSDIKRKKNGIAIKSGIREPGITRLYSWRDEHVRRVLRRVAY